MTAREVEAREVRQRRCTAGCRCDRCVTARDDEVREIQQKGLRMR
jgi:hypothetical protein